MEYIYATGADPNNVMLSSDRTRFNARPTERKYPVRAPTALQSRRQWCSSRQGRTCKVTLTDEATSDDYDRAAVALGITPAAAKQAAYRLRKRYRELFRAEVARTVDREEDVDQEIGRLLDGLG